MATVCLSFPIYLRLFIREANLIMFSCETLSSESSPISFVYFHIWLAAQRIISVEFPLSHRSVLGLFSREHFSFKAFSLEQRGVLWESFGVFL